jgi:hypothetical protein
LIVWLASFPRSGNTMLRIALHSVYGHASYSLYEEPPWAEAWESVASVMGSAGQVTARDLDELRQRRDLCFVKTHDRPLDDSPALCLVRDGRDALISYAHFVRAHERAMAEGRGFDEVLRLLIESRDHFGGWSGNVRAWYERPGRGRTTWLRYEDLIREPLRALEAAMGRLGVPLRAPAASMADFAELHRRWPEFFRRGKVGAWRDEMREELHRLFWQHHGEAMGWFGYRDRAEGACRTT